MMLTGIYLSATTTLTFSTSEAVVLIPFDSTKSSITATGSPLTATNVPAGIYKVETNDSIGCSPSSTSTCSTFETPNVKDPIPTPPDFAKAMYNNDIKSLDTFFVRANGRSIGFPTAAAAAHAR